MRQRLFSNRLFRQQNAKRELLTVMERSSNPQTKFRLVALKRQTLKSQTMRTAHSSALCAEGKLHFSPLE
jgi:hypothetical protein